jgi:2-C-methyl-D-erythritol 2,4-cyclodiphosphate synthase
LIEKKGAGMRIGQGWDRHALVAGRACVLGGVEFPHSPVGPLGHSDGDAVCHALTDAFLGAAAMGDIGSHFPDTDPRYKGADSTHLLKDAWNLVAAKGYTLANVDITIIAEQPRIAPMVTAMRERLASVLVVDHDKISIKATRGEGMGPEGRGECVTAMAVVLLMKISAEQGV